MVHEWKRFLAAVLALAFSALLIIVQTGLLLGMFGSVSVFVDSSRADLWVAAPTTSSFDQPREIPASQEVFLRMHPDVKRVQRLVLGLCDWRSPDGSKTAAFVVGVDTSKDSLGMPVSFDESMRAALMEPGGVVINDTDVEKLKVSVGGFAEINDKRVRVVGVMSGFRAIGGVNVVASTSTAARLLGGAHNADKTPYLLVKLKDPGRVDEARRELERSPAGSKYRLYSRDEFSLKSQLFWIMESGAGTGITFSSLLGVLVGVAITNQTLRAAILASIKEYATLRALGVSVRSLGMVVMEQALWVGLAGLLISGFLTVVIAMLAHANNVAIKFPLWAVLTTVACTVAIALGSGLMSLRVLYKTEPAELLR